MAKSTSSLASSCSSPASTIQSHSSSSSSGSKSLSSPTSSSSSYCSSSGDKRPPTHKSCQMARANKWPTSASSSIDRRKRLAANARERKRMNLLNNAYDELRNRLADAENKSKYDVLVQAKEYIQALASICENFDKNNPDHPSVRQFPHYLSQPTGRSNSNKTTTRKSSQAALIMTTNGDNDDDLQHNTNGCLREEHRHNHHRHHQPLNYTSRLDSPVSTISTHSNELATALELTIRATTTTINSISTATADSMIVYEQQTANDTAEQQPVEWQTIGNDNYEQRQRLEQKLDYYNNNTYDDKHQHPDTNIQSSNQQPFAQSNDNQIFLHHYQPLADTKLHQHQSQPNHTEPIFDTHMQMNLKCFQEQFFKYDLNLTNLT